MPRYELRHEMLRAGGEEPVRVRQCGEPQMRAEIGFVAPPDALVRESSRTPTGRGARRRWRGIAHGRGHVLRLSPERPDRSDHGLAPPCRRPTRLCSAPYHERRRRARSSGTRSARARPPAHRTAVATNRMGRDDARSTCCPKDGYPARGRSGTAPLMSTLRQPPHAKANGSARDPTQAAVRGLDVSDRVARAPRRRVARAPHRRSSSICSTCRSSDRTWRRRRRWLRNLAGWRTVIGRARWTSRNEPRLDGVGAGASPRQAETRAPPPPTSDTASCQHHVN